MKSKIHWAAIAFTAIIGSSVLSGCYVRERVGPRPVVVRRPVVVERPVVRGRVYVGP
jgi:hypothetical protein